AVEISGAPFQAISTVGSEASEVSAARAAACSLAALASALVAASSRSSDSIRAAISAICARIADSSASTEEALAVWARAGMLQHVPASAAAINEMLRIGPILFCRLCYHGVCPL